MNEAVPPKGYRAALLLYPVETYHGETDRVPSPEYVALIDTPEHTRGHPMNDSPTPVAGWYDDPEMVLRLRWWDGTRWSQHTRPKRVVEQHTEQPTEHRTENTIAAQSDAAGMASGGSTGIVTGSTLIAQPYTGERYAYSAPFSWSPGTVTAGTPASPVVGAPGSLPRPLGADGAAARHPDELWHAGAVSIDYSPERTNTSAVWALAVTPLVTVLAQAAAIVLSGFESTEWVWIAGAIVIPLLWLIIWVRRDRITLHEWGHLRRAHWGWAFLGAVGYLVARTLVVRRQTGGRGWWPLLVNLAITAVLVNVGLFTPVFGVFLDAIF